MKNFDYPQYIAETKSFYDEKFGNSAFVKLNEEENERWGKIEQAIKNEVTSTKNRNIKILDFGCGDGRFSKLLEKYGVVSGVDISGSSIKKARKLMNSIDFHVCDISSENVFDYFTEGEFDFVISTEVLEHVYDKEGYLFNIYRLLKKGGILILTTPNGKCFHHYFGNHRGLGGQAFEWWIGKKALENALFKLGFRDIKIQDFSFNWVLYKRKSLSLRLIFNRWVVSFIRKSDGIQLVEKIVEKTGFGLYLMSTSRK